MKPPHQCPACKGALEVNSLGCAQCGTKVEGRYSLCPFCRLGAKDQALLHLFLKARGNVKELQRELGVSYPTARAKLDQLWKTMGYAPDPHANETADEILMELRTGQITVEEATRRLRSRGIA